MPAPGWNWEGFGIAEWAVLPDGSEVVKGLLCGIRVAALKRAGQLLQVGAATVVESLKFLEN